MRKTKLALIQLKGFGDLLVTLKFLKSLKNFDILFLIPDKSSNLLNVFDAAVKREVLSFQNGGPAFYNLKAGFANVFRDFIYVRTRVKKLIAEGYACVVDFDSFRNKIVFFGLPVSYLSKSQNIYKAYENFFGTRVNYSPTDRLKKIFIFPFGSSSDRWMPYASILKMCSVLLQSGIEVVCLVHVSQVNIYDFSELPLCVYGNFDEFDELLRNFDGIITVDSMALHYAYCLNKRVYIVSDSWKMFIPDDLLGNFFGQSAVNQLLAKVLLDKNNIECNKWSVE